MKTNRLRLSRTFSSRRSAIPFVPGLVWTALLCLSAPLASQAAGSNPRIALQPVAEGLVSPTVLIPVPDGSGRMLLCDQIGTIHVLTKEGLRPELFLDLRSRLVQLNQGFDERGVLGLALHPQFNSNGRFFVYYSAPLRPDAPKDWNHTSHVSEFKIREGAAFQADPNSERILLQIDQPSFNHNCGRLVFGPDGYLYIALGDGGEANDAGIGHPPEGNGQNLQTLLGKILRIDVDSAKPYGIPADNPFADKSKSARPEIFAYGLRNPWGLSFDTAGNRDLIAVDVGQNRYEEINLIVKGGNYGWNIREGFDCFDPNNPNNPPADCPKVGANGEPLLDPVLAYKSFRAFPRDPESRGTSITGGYVYHGKAFPHLQGKYIFADWSRNWVIPDGVLYSASRPANDSSSRWTMEPLDVVTQQPGRLGLYVLAFGQDEEGELYILTTRINSLEVHPRIGKTGRVFKLVPHGT